MEYLVIVLNNSAKAKEKVNRKWIEKDCIKDCEFRQSKKYTKTVVPR